MFYITEDTTEYKGKNGVLIQDTTKITITATPSSKTDTAVSNMTININVTFTNNITSSIGQYAWKNDLTSVANSEWKTLTLNTNGDKERTGEIISTQQASGDYYLWIKVVINGKEEIKRFGEYKFISNPTQNNLICKIVSKSADSTTGTAELGSDMLFDGWTLSYTINGGTATTLTQGTTTTVNNITKGDLVVIKYSKENETDVTKTLNVDELKIGYVLNYDTKGGTIIASDVQYDNSEFTVTSIVPTKDGYIFDSWNVEEDGKGTKYNAGNSINISTEKNKTLYAQWQVEIIAKEELPYLVTTGNQYIDTGFIPNQDTTIEIKYRILSQKVQFIYSARIDTHSNTYGLCYDQWFGPNEIRSDYYNNQSYGTVSGDLELKTVKQDKNKLYVNNNLILTQTYNTFSTNNNLYLFASNKNGVIDNTLLSTIQFFYCKIWDNGTLIRDFIPAKDKNGNIFIYDKLNNQAYYALYGDQQEEFQYNPQHIEINALRCNGNQYVDTGFKPNQNTTIEMKFNLSQVTTENFALFGARTKNIEKTYAAFFLSSSKELRGDYNTVMTTLSVLSVGQDYIYKQDKNSFYINNSLKASTSAGTFNCDYNLNLFAVNTAGTVTLKSIFEFYYCKIWDNGTLIREFIPVVVNSNNKIALYDKVNNTYYYSSGNDFLLSNK